MVIQVSSQLVKSTPLLIYSKHDEQLGEKNGAPTDVRVHFVGATLVRGPYICLQASTAL